MQLALELAEVPAEPVAVCEALGPEEQVAVVTTLRQLDRLTAELGPLRCRLHRHGRRQQGCRALSATMGSDP